MEGFGFLKILVEQISLSLIQYLFEFIDSKVCLLKIYFIVSAMIDGGDPCYNGSRMGLF